LMRSGDYCAALAHAETAVSLYRPDEHRDSALHYGQDIGSAPLSSCPWGSGIAAILINPRGLPIVRSATAGNWDLPPPLPTPGLSRAGPPSAPEGWRPPAPAAAIAWRSRVNTDSPHGRPTAGFSRVGPTPKRVKRRRELPASATVWPRPRRPALA